MPDVRYSSNCKLCYVRPNLFFFLMWEPHSGIPLFWPSNAFIQSVIQISYDTMIQLMLDGATHPLYEVGCSKHFFLCRPALLDEMIFPALLDDPTAPSYARMRTTASSARFVFPEKILIRFS